MASTPTDCFSYADAAEGGGPPSYRSDLPTRDRWGRLHCREDRCKAVIGGHTGLQELDKLRAHLIRRHAKRLDFQAVMALREEWEENG
jgi:hypothetical protein